VGVVNLLVGGRIEALSQILIAVALKQIRAVSGFHIPLRPEAGTVCAGSARAENHIQLSTSYYSTASDRLMGAAWVMGNSPPDI